MKDHFAHNKEVKYKFEQLITVEEEEVRYAILEIEKKKKTFS